jgi:general secretion pathway protein H
VGRYRTGFTLIELLVVLAIGSLLVALMPTAIDKLRDASQYRDAVRSILVDLKFARQQASTYGQFAVFQIDLHERKFGIVGKPFKTLPPSLEIKATVGRDDIRNQTHVVSITFMPEGGSSGGTIELLRRSGSGARLRVDWLFGQITQEALTP